MGMRRMTNQLEVLREDVRVSASDVLDVRVEGETVTQNGLRNDVSVAVQCLDAWLDDRGAVGLLNLMEDAAAAEIARAKVLTLPGYERLP
jgi:malate synthase